MCISQGCCGISSLSYRAVLLVISAQYVKKNWEGTVIESLFPVCMYCQHLDQQKSNVWKRVMSMHVLPNAKTFSFKLHSSTLPVRTLHEKGMSIPWLDIALYAISQRQVNVVHHTIHHVSMAMATAAGTDTGMYRRVGDDRTNGVRAATMAPPPGSAETVQPSYTSY